MVYLTNRFSPNMLVDYDKPGRCVGVAPVAREQVLEMLSGGYQAIGMSSLFATALSKELGVPISAKVCRITPQHGDKLLVVQWHGAKLEAPEFHNGGRLDFILFEVRNE